MDAPRFNLTESGGEVLNAERVRIWRQIKGILRVGGLRIKSAQTENSAALEMLIECYCADRTFGARNNRMMF